MSLQPRFEDVLHLVMWNGYTEDCRQAVYVSKKTYTDERIWFPFLIQHGHGKKKKTVLQVIATHCTDMQHIHSNVYKSEDRWMRRMEQLQQMAKDTHHMKLFEDTLRKTDTDGCTILHVASKNNCSKIVLNLLRRGVDYNREDTRGATPEYYAYNSKLGQKAWNCIIHETKFESVYKAPVRVYQPPAYQVLPQQNFQQLLRNYLIIPNINLPFRRGVFLQDIRNQPAPVHTLTDYRKSDLPKKRLKASEYKKQFGR